MKQTIETIPFQHAVHKHCESGAIANMLRYYNVHLSEPMVFGIGAGLFFTHTSKVKVLDAPITAYRYYPGKIFECISKSLHIETGTRAFWNERLATSCLDKKLREGTPVGLLTDIYYLDYIPEAIRFHFSAHNLTVYGKEMDKYLISDPIIEVPVMLHEEQLLKARFNKSVITPKAKMYWIKKMPNVIPLEAAIIKGIKLVYERMTAKYLNWEGYVAMRKLAKKIASYPEKHGAGRASLLLLNVVRMQEVVGTGGAGFRPMYADFLKEAATYLLPEELPCFSEEMHTIANDWRIFALMATRCAKRNDQYSITYKQISEYLIEIAEKEHSFFTQLNKTLLKHRL